MSEKEEDSPEVVKAKALSNWAMFDVHTWSDYPEVNKAVNVIYEELSSDTSYSGHKKVRKKHLKVVILDVYAKWLAHRDKYTGIYRRKSEYRAGSRYNKIHISRLIVKVMDLLHSYGYIEKFGGVHGRDEEHKSYVTRIKATKKLINLIIEHEWREEMVDMARNRECIELRDYNEEKDKQVPVEYEDTPDTIRMRKDLTAYNNLIRDAHIDVLGFPEKGIKKVSIVRGRKHTWLFHIQRNQKFTRRIFNNGTWDDGGRFYGPWWQQIPNGKENGAWRKHIYIMGMPTVEIDYSGLHIVLLYALENLDYWSVDGEDPYSLPGYDNNESTRELLKLLLLIAVNVDKATDEERKKTALKAIQSEINSNFEQYQWIADSGIKLGDVIDDFKARHNPIKHHFFTGAGASLQKLDSLMAEYVINKMTKDHHPVLCIHDSFICEEPLFGTLQELVIGAFEKVIKEVFPSLSTMVPKIKFVDPKGDKTASYKALFERNRKSWMEVAIDEPQANSPYMHRLEAYDRSRWEGPHDYFTDTDVSYVVPDMD